VNLALVDNELGRAGRVRADYRDPNNAGVSALFHRDLRFANSRAPLGPASTGTREETASRSAPLTPRMRAPESRSGARLLRTTRRRAGRNVSCWRVCGRGAYRTSCGPSGDAGNNPCSRQAVVLVREALRVWRPRDRGSRHRRRLDAGWRRWRARRRCRARRMTGSSGAGGIGPRRCCARSVDARRSRCGGHRETLGDDLVDLGGGGFEFGHAPLDLLSLRACG